MRVLVVGLGSIGKRHLANVRSLYPAADITVWRQHAPPGEPVPAEADRCVYSAAEALAAQPETALVCNPAVLHIETAQLLADNGIHLLIEKPLSHSLAGVDELIAACRRRNLVLMVAYPLRFSDAMRVTREALLNGSIGRLLALHAETGSYLPEWRAADYRNGVSARSDLGGGVVLELSHELDYARWLAGEVESVTAVTARVSDLDIDVEDMAEIVLRFRGGAIGNVHVDMVERAPLRRCRLAGSDGTLVWDGLRNAVQLYSAADRSWRDLLGASACERNQMYLAELSHFFDCVSGLRAPLITGEDGRRTLELALAAKRSAEECRTVALAAEAGR